MTVAACSSGGEEADPSGSSPAAVSSSVAPALGTEGVTTGRPDLTAPEEVATGLEVPWGLTFLPDGSALVGERGTGRVLRLDPDGAEPVLVRQFDVSVQIEGGLLGLAASPGYAEDGWVYAYYTAEDAARVVRFRLHGSEPEVVLDGIERGPGHSGGRLAFGPDGMLYATVGDGTDDERPQDPENLGGKILRITPDGDPAPGNPFPGSPVWSLGHRNPQGIAWDASGRLFSAEFGEDAVDEVNLIEPGGNYGWPLVEGVDPSPASELVNPVLTWPVAEASPSGIAITGDVMYVGALRGERLWEVPLEGDGLGEPVAHLVGEYGRLRTVEVAPDGALWVTTSNQQRSGDPREGDDRVLRFPVR